jgi:uncharacterized protein YdiU (UPF0061 family)
VNLDYSYAHELSDLGSLVKPAGIKNPRLIHVNQPLRQALKLPSSWFGSQSLIKMLFEQQSPLNKWSMAQKYGGHQFGGWNPDLGDGRGLLLGETTDETGQRWDLHLKGAGPTPYSRFADGRAVLRSTLREYLASEALHHLGIPTSRALCLLTSEEPVYREKQEYAAMMIRACQSHIRFGHFEYFYYRNEHDKLQRLFDYCFKYHFSHVAQDQYPHLGMLKKIVSDTAELVAKWQAFGFNHGVMNTDNMSIHGITFDFGPYAFLDDFAPDFVCNQSDHQGRYAFEQQPSVALWNLNALAHAFSPYLTISQIKSALGEFEPQLLSHYYDLMYKKLGLPLGGIGNQDLINQWLNLLEKDKRDYHISFRLLCDVNELADNSAFINHFIDRDAATIWLKSYQAALLYQGKEPSIRQQQMKQCNPNYVLRNYLAQLAIDDCEQGDFGKFEELLNVLQQPFADLPQYAQYAKSPPNWGKHLKISCSS